MSTAEALKALGAKLIGGDVTADDVKGFTIPEILNFITENFGAGKVGTLGTLTVKSVEGAETGTTKITITPAKSSGNSYVYKTSPSSIDPPEYLETVSGGTGWNGTDDITAEDGHKIAVYEVNASGQAVAFGTVGVTVKL